MRILVRELTLTMIFDKQRSNKDNLTIFHEIAKSYEKLQPKKESETKRKVVTIPTKASSMLGKVSFPSKAETMNDFSMESASDVPSQSTASSEVKLHLQL